MDEIIEGILGHITLQVLLQQGSGLLALAGGNRSKQCDELCITQRQNPFLNSVVIFLCVLALLVLGDVVHEADHNFARLCIIFKGLDAGIVFLILGKEHEGTLAVLAFLIVILLGGCVYQTEMHSNTVKNESVILEVFAGLDVILILICPIQLYFFAFVGDCIHAFLVTTLGNKVASPRSTC